MCEKCHYTWTKFAKWYISSVEKDCRVQSEPSPVYDCNFHGKSFEYCPFCGVKFDPKIPILNRHP